MKQLNSTSLRLSDYAGKVILLDFWATWCAPCRDEIPHFVQWQAKYGNQGLQVVGVSMDDDLRPLEKFTGEFKMNYPVVVGSQELASGFGGILGLPANIVIGRNGKIVAKHLGLTDLSLLERELASQLALK
jgi:thiol-disulfide isomerase/thioredoxin